MSKIVYSKGNGDLEEITTLSGEDPGNVLRRERHLLVRSRGQSMYPLIRSGDILIINPATDEELNSGDIAYYRHSSGYYVVHRFIRRNGSGFLVITGDNRRHPDDPVDGEQVFGRVAGIEREGKILTLKGNLNTFIGWLTVLLACIRLPLQIHLKQTMGRLHWLLGGRRAT